uniref:probable G-protein coupled receptor 139 n=1 Tax=Pristiophorus japonicus TaxID=55135 RepID=UPI00398E42C1
MDWNVTTMGHNLSTMDWNVTTMGQNLSTMDWNISTMGRSTIWEFDTLSEGYNGLMLEYRIELALRVIQHIYYPFLAALGVPVNLVTIVILSRGKCGLSKCITRYLVAMATADLLVVIVDLILRHMPILYSEQFAFVRSLLVCNIHTSLLYTVTDCSVWFTVTFTFDRFVAICCQKLKTKYCTERTAAVVLGTVVLLSGLKDTFWYFMLTRRYSLWNAPWFCEVSEAVLQSQIWATMAFLHYIVTPAIPFIVILLLNALTVRHISVSSRARRRLRGPSSADRPKDPEMESRRKSIISLFIISGNFILLWAMLMVFSIWIRMYYLGYKAVFLPYYVMEMGLMMQLLSCCTNTGIYAMTQTKFRAQLKNAVKYPFTQIAKFIKR